MLPLKGLKVVEFEGIGPGPVAGMFLAQLGASVTLVRRPKPLAIKGSLEVDDPIDGAKRGLRIDLKRPEGVDLALRLIERADALIEGNRPGVMERLGLGPEVCLARHPLLVYGRMTGWGQSGPLANTAGHDLNYVALTGLLALSRRGEGQPIIPPTVIGDAAGALGLAFGLLAGVFDANRTGRGSVVDAAMVDISAMLGALVHLLRVRGLVATKRPSMFYDSPFYDVYGCADGKSITVGALEPQFYALLLTKLGMTDVDPALQYDETRWPALKQRFATLFASRSRAEWCALLEGTDVCFAPVLDLEEAGQHPHMVARGVFRRHEAGLFAAPAPRFSGGDARDADKMAQGDLLEELGLSAATIARLQEDGVITR